VDKKEYSQSENLMSIKRQILSFAAMIFVIMLFNSYGRVLTFNLHEDSLGFMQNFWEVWKPSFGVSNEYSVWFNYIQIIPYIFLMVYFIRKANIFSYEFMLFVIISLAYSCTHGGARYREPFMLVLIIWVGKRFELS
jgi:lipoprotein signal peptidase